jgi:hypothetical protein
MNILQDKYFIVRTGDFATNANKKIAYFLLACLLCIHDCITNKNREYLEVMVGSSIIWTFVELFLNETKVRIIKPMKIIWNKQEVIVNKYIGILFQGIQEGGVVTIIGLYFGDRFYSWFYQLLYHGIIFYMMANMLNKKSDPTVLSRRQINTPVSLCLMSSATIFNVTILLYNPNHFYRTLNMFIAMVYLCSIWTVISYCKGFRKVEVYLYNNNYTRKQNNLIDAFLILGYDVVFEIGIAYITFYNMFVIPYNQVIKNN